MSFDNGYGICGHKNVYNSRVLCGNWVEDNFGAIHAANKQDEKMTTSSEAKERFCDPMARRTRDADGKPSKKISMTSLALEHALLLNHCEKGNIHITPSDSANYKTTHELSFSKASIPPKGHQVNARQRQIHAEQRKLSSPFDTSYRHQSRQPFQPQASARVGKSDGKRFVPDMGFSKSFIQAQQFDKIARDLQRM